MSKEQNKKPIEEKSQDTSKKKIFTKKKKIKKNIRRKSKMGLRI